MAAAVGLRGDFDGPYLRALAKSTRAPLTLAGFWLWRRSTMAGRGPKDRLAMQAERDSQVRRECGLAGPTLLLRDGYDPARHTLRRPLTTGSGRWLIVNA